MGFITVVLLSAGRQLQGFELPLVTAGGPHAAVEVGTDLGAEHVLRVHPPPDGEGAVGPLRDGPLVILVLAEHAAEVGGSWRAEPVLDEALGRDPGAGLVRAGRPLRRQRAEQAA